MSEHPMPARDAQRRFWNEWNTTVRERQPLDPASRRRGAAALDLLGLVPRPPGVCSILEVGCGTGWLTAQLTAFGSVTAVDLADDVVGRGRERVPEARFLAGDFFDLPLPAGGFHVVITLETVAHVADQQAFFERCAALLAPGGHLIVTTQNRFVMERADVPPPGAGQIRRWLDRRSLRRLVTAAGFHVVRTTTILPVGNHGVLRVVNSARLSALLGLLLSPPRIERLKERAGFGQTLVLLARKRAANGA